MKTTFRPAFYVISVLFRKKNTLRIEATYQIVAVVPPEVLAAMTARH